MNEAEQELIAYLHNEFPSTRGHIALVGKVHLVWRRGMNDAVRIVNDASFGDEQDLRSIRARIELARDSNIDRGPSSIDLYRSMKSEG